MENDVDLILQNIKKEIHKKYGREVRYAKDCQILSHVILEETNRQLSVTTLKRFFGIVQSPFKPSKYTLDSLAVYTGYENWEDFVKRQKNNHHAFSHLQSWDELRKRFISFTQYSLNSYHSKLGENVHYFPSRSFAEQKIENFLNSSHLATAFIAPDGYGKSTILYQLTKKYFIDENAVYPNDIACLIDGSILFEFMYRNPDNVFIQNLFNFEAKNSFSNLFRKKPSLIKGRFVLIIDGLNEIFYQTERLNHFIDNLLDILTFYENTPWFKLIISCKPDVWNIFCNRLNKKPAIKSKWCDVAFEGPASDTINIPLLEKHEIKEYLEKNHPELRFENLIFHYPEITEIINNPYFLHLFSQVKDKEIVHTDIELLNQVAQQTVLSQPYACMKVQIIHKIFDLSDYGQNFTPVKKADLDLKDDYLAAYQELLDYNILHEYTIPGSYLTIDTFVNFSHDILMEFFLANKWLKENKLNLDLLRQIKTFYKNNRHLQRNLMKYIIKIAFKEGKTDVLKNIYSIFEKNEQEKNSTHTPIDPEITQVIGVELRKDKAVRDFLIPQFAKTDLGKLYFFENYFDMDSLVLHSGDNIRFYLENNHSSLAKIYGHFLKFMQHFLAQEHTKCQTEYEKIRAIKLPVNCTPLHAGFYYSTQVIYESVYRSGPDELLLEKIKEKADYFYKKGIQSKTGIPNFDFLIIFSLHYGSQSSHIIDFAESVFNRYIVIEFASSWTYQLFMAIYSRALFNMGEEKKALKLFKQVEFKSIPYSYKYYIKLRYYLIHIEFLIYENNLNKAKELIEDVKIISQMIRFKFFYDKAVFFEKIVCPEPARETMPKQKRH